MNPDKLTPQARYDAAHTVQITMKLNRTTDADILDRLQTVPNRQGYIKRLIRQDMASDKINAKVI